MWHTTKARYPGYLLARYPYLGTRTGTQVHLVHPYPDTRVPGYGYPTRVPGYPYCSRGRRGAVPARSLLQRRDAPPVVMLGVGNLMLGMGAVVLFNSTKMLLVGIMNHEGANARGGCGMMMHTPGYPGRGEG